jgi:hypothetical protein
MVLMFSLKLVQLASFNQAVASEMRTSLLLLTNTA